LAYFLADITTFSAQKAVIFYTWVPSFAIKNNVAQTCILFTCLANSNANQFY